MTTQTMQDLEDFTERHPAIWAWIDAERARFEFAQSMFDDLRRYGRLTERQLAACERCVERAQTRRTAVVSAEATERLRAAFDHAKANGLKHPKMRFSGVTASLAGASSKNAGAIYIKRDKLYLGKIAGGRFFGSRDCTDGARDSVLAAMADPLAAAVAYGRATGTCSCCGRALSDPISVARGIGPVCAGNFGL
jgi:hypothetical protein